MSEPVSDLEPISIGNCPVCNAFPVQHIAAPGDTDVYKYLTPSDTLAPQVSDAPANLVGQLVVGLDACGGSPQFVAEVAGYYDAPTYIFAQTPFQAWRADLVRPATPEEAAIYWRERALKAEGKEAQLRG